MAKTRSWAGYTCVVLLLCICVVGSHGLALDGSLKTKLEAALAISAEASSSNEADELEDGFDLMQLDFASGSALKEKIDQEALFQMSSSSKMYFDCWNKTNESCESHYCVWINSKCAISSAAYNMLCGFYCEPSLCLAPIPSNETNQEKTPCVPKPRFLVGLCHATQSRANCNAQAPLCTMTSKGNPRCIDAPTCCSRAKKYCSASRNKSGLLQKALQQCSKYTTKQELCNYATTACNS